MSIPTKGVPELSDAQKSRFWSKVDRRRPDDCWPWTGYALRGYGQLTLNERGYLAHRVAFSLGGGEVGDALICHRCDNRACCNPAHLFAGTAAQNTADMMSKGRHRIMSMPHSSARGERIAQAVLTDADVLKIRDDGRSQRAIAASYGVAQTTIGKIKSRRSWAHI